MESALVLTGMSRARQAEAKFHQLYPGCVSVQYSESESGRSKYGKATVFDSAKLTVAALLLGSSHTTCCSAS